MLRHNRAVIEALGQRTSDLLERIQRLEAAQAALRAQVESERQLRFLVAEIVAATQVAPIIGGAVEKFAQALRAPVALPALEPRRYFDGTFMPESEKEAAYLDEYERYAACGRARASSATRAANGTFMPRAPE